MRIKRGRKEGGPNLHRDRKLENAEVQAAFQPAKCRGCKWGRFDGGQLCIWQKCVKEGESDVAGN